MTRRVSGGDIRLLGDGNMGAKNTFDSVGRLPGLAVGVLDVGKGLLVVVAARHLGVSGELLLLIGILAVLGHDFPVYLRFRGGQGLASSVGTFLALFPLQMLVAAAVIALSLAFTRRWEGSLAIGFVVMIALLLWSGVMAYVLYAVILLIGVAVGKVAARRRQGRPAA